MAHEGLCEYELVDLDGEATSEGTTAATLALTLVRATGLAVAWPMPSRPLPAGPEDPLEGAQCQGPLRLRYAVALDAEATVDPHELADRVSPLVCDRARRWVAGPGVRGSRSTAPPSTRSCAGAPRRGRGTSESTDPLAGAPGARVAGQHGSLVVADREGSVVDLRGTRIGAFDGAMALPAPDRDAAPRSAAPGLSRSGRLAQ